MPAVGHSKHFVLCDTADMCHMSHRRHVCCVAQLKSLLCHTADTPAVSHSRHVENRVADGPTMSNAERHRAAREKGAFFLMYIA